MPGDEVIKWLAEAMRPKVGNEADKTAAALLDYIGRRSGLLLPRGENQFAFLHLTFQEYYAALSLRDCHLTGPDWQDASREDPDTALERFREYANSTVWQETFLLLFESSQLTRVGPPNSSKSTFRKRFQ